MKVVYQQRSLRFSLVPNAMGISRKVWKDREDSYHEINIGAEYLSRPIKNVLATLLQEIVHLYCMVSFTKDTSNGGRHHNKRFKKEAEKQDLQIGYAKYIGFSVTSPIQRFIEVIRDHDLYSQMGHCRTTGGSILPPPYPTSVDGTGLTGVDASKKKTSNRKDVCNRCSIANQIKMENVVDIP